MRNYNMETEWVQEKKLYYLMPGNIKKSDDVSLNLGFTQCVLIDY